MLPNMSNAIKAYFQPLTFYKVEKRVVDYELQEVLTKIQTRGVRQPTVGEDLNITSEGQKEFKYLEDLHCLPDVKLNIDDIVQFNGTNFRILQKFDCSEYGYIEYIMSEDYKDTPQQ